MNLNYRQLEGETLDEYALNSLIGTGGMSAVYRAYHDELDRYVAVKVLSSDLAEQDNYAQRFTDEARMAAALEHPHIIPIYEFGTRDNLSFVVMRLLNGGTIGDRLYGNRPLRTDEIIEVVTDIGKALDYAHSRGIIHRDIKPSNIMFDEQGTAYLVDFGIAKAVQADKLLTTENIVLGTPNYMPPEQWRDDPLTPKLDQYALAVLTYQMLTNVQPFDAEGVPQTMYRHLNEAPTPAHEVNTNLPPAVSGVLNQALAKEPDERYETVSAFASALKQALQDAAPDVTSQHIAAVTAEVSAVPTVESEVEAAEPIPDPALPPSTPQQNPVLPPSERSIMLQVAMGCAAGLVLLVVLLAGGASILFSLFGPDEPPAASSAPTALATATQEDLLVVASETPQTGSVITRPTLTPLPFSQDDVASFASGRFLHRELQTPVRDAAFSPDGRFIASGHGDGLVRIWNAQQLGEAARVLNGHSDVVSAVALSADGMLLASGGRDRSVILWNTEDGSRIRSLTHGAAVRDLAFSPDGSLLGVASEDGVLTIWNSADGTQAQQFRQSSSFFAVAFSPDGSEVAGAGDDLLVRRWRLSDGNALPSFSGHTDSIRGLAYSPDGIYMASSSLDNSARIWVVASGEQLRSLRGHGSDVWTATFSPDSSLLATGGRDNSARVWTVETGSQVAELDDFQGWVLGVAFGPAGDVLLTGAGDGTVRLWQVE